ncbi:glycine zipper 2TM domain-containing protein [Caenimonas sp. SL110]|uniref:glycine zipper 2TM domain-containing protein n=1 Tax=Caenimonas sp. SL110 TaxID=1450524 RepID=UPI0006543078|nr:glycine zipper 2TM domain-containing protein [Caenimonas sp. SL110]
MKKFAMFSAIGMLAATAGVAHAQQDVGRVISSTPVVQQVPVPRQVCQVQPMAAQPSGAGAVIGAIAGGLLGNTIGHGGGRFAATGIGMVAGAAIGNSVEGNNGYARSGQYCTTESTYENRTVAYNVTYEYQGRQYTTQMANDPGPTIQLQVTPVGATTLQGDGGANWTPRATIISSEVIAQPMVDYPVYSSGYSRPYYAPAYPAYAPSYAPYIAPIGISLGLGYYGGSRHRHWR